LSSSSPSSTISKSESLKSTSRFQRKFNGPLHQISCEAKIDSVKPQVEPQQQDVVASKNTASEMDTTHTTHTTSDAEKAADHDGSDENIDTELYKDYDNIYDTVAPDSECDSDLNEDKTQSIRDDETSSHEMLSRSSSTDELSNYVNIDYFLRKNSLSRSNSNIHAGLNKKNYFEDGEEHEDTETNMSSMKSSDYDNFSSNENLIDSIPPQSTSLRSFNSISTNSSTSGSSLRTRSLKLFNNNDLSASYPTNLSTFTPPIRDRNQNQFVFSKDSPLSEKDECTGISNGSELNLSSNSKNTSLNNSSSEDYYAYTDILESCKLLLYI